MDTLSKLFGSEARVKMIRLFLFNPEQPFCTEDIAQRVKVSTPSVRHEVAILKKIDMIRGKQFTHIVSVKKNRKLETKRKKEGGWVLNSNFPYLAALKDLLINTILVKPADVVRRLNTSGKIKLVIFSGLFIGDEESRVDLFVVGDLLKFNILENVIRSLESEIGKEIRYAAFETGDFRYRKGLNDKLIRDILDYPHKIIMDKVGLEPVSTD